MNAPRLTGSRSLSALRRVRRRVLVSGFAGLALGAIGLAWVATADDATAAAAARYTINDAAVSFSSNRAEKTDTGYRFWFFDKKFAGGRTLKMSVVGPHQKSHAPHKHDGHEFFYVLEGKAEFFLDGKTRVVGAQTGLYCPPWSMHGIRNVGSTELKYLVIKDYVEEFPKR